MPVASRATCVQPSADNHSDNAMRSLVVVLNVRTSLFTAPSTIWRTQATTVSPAFARAGSCEYQDRHNVDAELPLLLLKCRRLGTPLWKSRTRAPGLLPARDTIWGAQGFRVRLTDGLARTKITPTSVPTARRQPTQDYRPFHILRVGNFGGRLTRRESASPHRRVEQGAPRVYGGQRDDRPDFHQLCFERPRGRRDGLRSAGKSWL